MLNWISFIGSQLDYIYFFYGLAFIALGVRVLSIKKKEENISWTFLGWFGLIHGFNEWLDMIAFSSGDSLYFKIARVIIMIVSFIALGEFWRRNCQKIKVGKWIWGVILIIILILSKLDVNLMGILARYLIAFPAGAMGAFFVYNFSRIKKNRHLLFLAVLLFVYAVLAGLITNNTWFLNTFLVPIQLLRGVCAIWMAVIINNYLITQNIESKKIPKTIVLIMVIAINVLISGWFVVEFGGRAKLSELKNNLLSKTRILGAAVNPERVKTLTGTMADKESVDYLRIKEQLRWAMEEDMNIRYAYLMKERNKEIIFLASVINKGIDEIEEYPGEVYEDTDNTFKDYIGSSKSGIFGPYTDKWGTLITGVVPIIDKSNGQFLALFGMDVKAEYIEKDVKRERLEYIFIFGLVELILLVVLGFSFSMDQAITKIRQSEEKMKEKVAELEKINKLMVGRELKMIELKKQIKEEGKI